MSLPVPLPPRLAAIALALSLIAPTARGQDAGAALPGESVFARHCAACHQTGPGAAHRIGPHLAALAGRPAGQIAGFGFSAAMAAKGQAGLTWTAETLDAFLRRPRDLVPGTRMAYAGLRKDADRAALLAFLLQSDAVAAPPDAAPGLDPAILALEGDAEYGEYLGGECLACHRKDGADQGIPSITGWPTADFVTAMHQFRNKERANPVMQMIAGRLGNEEIAALAAWFAKPAP